MTAFVALLRGINVGGANILPMAELRSLFSEAGGAEVATLLQSGNVVFAAEDGVAVAQRARLMIQSRHGFDIPVITRDAPNWRRSMDRNPFLAAGMDSATLHLACLSSPPSAHAIATLDPDRSRPDEFKLVGADVYLHLPNGVARSKLTNAWLDKTLGVVSTMRNWRTVERIAQVLGA